MHKTRCTCTDHSPRFVSEELPLVLDNSGADDLANSNSVGGRTRHVDVRLHYLRELKEEGLFVNKHISGIFQALLGRMSAMVEGEDGAKKRRGRRFANGSRN